MVRCVLGRLGWSDPCAGCLGRVQVINRVVMGVFQGNDCGWERSGFGTGCLPGALRCCVGSVSGYELC